MVVRSSPLIVTMAALLLVVLVACGGESKPTPSPTVTPAPNLIAVDPAENSAEFLRALPASERQCLEQAADSEELADEAAQETLRACLSEETIQSLILGQEATEAEQEACLVEAIGEQSGRELFSGQRQPSSDELDALDGCGIRWPGSADYFDTLPEAPAPAELSTVAWPDNVQGASALFGRLPSEIAGHGIRAQFDQSDPGRFDTTYGEDPQTHEPELEATVQDLTKGDFFPPDTNAGQFVAFFAQGFDWEVLAAGREGDLAWVQIKTTGTTDGVTRDVYGML